MGTVSRFSFLASLLSFSSVSFISLVFGIPPCVSFVRKPTYTNWVIVWSPTTAYVYIIRNEYLKAGSQWSLFMRSQRDHAITVLRMILFTPVWSASVLLVMNTVGYSIMGAWDLTCFQKRHSTRVWVTSNYHTTRTLQYVGFPPVRPGCGYLTRGCANYRSMAEYNISERALDEI